MITLYLSTLSPDSPIHPRAVWGYSASVLLITKHIIGQQDLSILPSTLSEQHTHHRGGAGGIPPHQSAQSRARLARLNILLITFC